jgi:hypothetical protein
VVRLFLFEPHEDAGKAHHTPMGELRRWWGSWLFCMIGRRNSILTFLRAQPPIPTTIRSWARSGFSRKTFCGTGNRIHESINGHILKGSRKERPITIWECLQTQMDPFQNIDYGATINNGSGPKSQAIRNRTAKTGEQRRKGRLRPQVRSSKHKLLLGSNWERARERESGREGESSSFAGTHSSLLQ